MSLGLTFGISLSQKKPSETAAPADWYPLRTGRLRLRPPPCAAHRFTPATEELVALGRRHHRLVGRRLAPHLANLAGAPETGCDAGEVGRAERRRLGDLGHDHRCAEHIGLDRKST